MKFQPWEITLALKHHKNKRISDINITLYTYGIISSTLFYTRKSIWLLYQWKSWSKGLKIKTTFGPYFSEEGKFEHPPPFFFYIISIWGHKILVVEQNSFINKFKLLWQQIQLIQLMCKNEMIKKMNVLFQHKYVK